jgi:hypothetical protein
MKNCYVEVCSNCITFITNCSFWPLTFRGEYLQLFKFYISQVT